MRLFVSNIDYKVDEDELRDLFVTGGYLPVSLRIIRDHSTGESRGFGFVDLGDAPGGEKAIQDLDGEEFNGRRISVREAEPEPPLQGGSGRGRGHDRERGRR